MQTGHGEKLSRKQEQAIAALLRHPTIAAAAGECGVAEVTLWRWLQDEGFARAYREARARLLEAALTALQSASGDAVTCLRDVVNDKTALVTARVTAARAILETALKAREALDFEERLATLEARLADQSPARKEPLRRA